MVLGLRVLFSIFFFLDNLITGRSHSLTVEPMEDEVGKTNYWHMLNGIFLILCVFTFTCLIMALGYWPYDYYIFLRWVVFMTSIVGVCLFLYRKNFIGAMALLSILLLFNPIQTVHLNRSIWSVLDVAAAIVFVIMVFYVNNDPLFGNYLTKNRYFLSYFIVAGFIIMVITSAMSYSYYDYYTEPEEAYMRSEMYESCAIRLVMLSILIGGGGYYFFLGDRD